MKHSYRCTEFILKMYKFIRERFEHHHPTHLSHFPITEKKYVRLLCTQIYTDYSIQLNSMWVVKVDQGALLSLLSRALLM